MTARPLAAAAALLAAFFMAAPAAGQTNCGDHAPLTRHLEKTYQEVPQSKGLSARGAVIEVFASPTGTWTILVTYPTGKTCIIASGEAWERLPVAIKGPAA